MIPNRIIILYQKKDGEEPVVDWLKSLDSAVRARIKTRIARLASSGHFGDWQSLSGGLFEMRFSFGAGYRLYYSLPNDRFVVLLNGGTKRTQKKDIDIAFGYLKDLKNTNFLKEKTL